MIGPTPIPYLYKTPCQGMPTTYSHLRHGIYNLDEVFSRIRKAILNGDYVTARALLKTNSNYVEGQSETAYDNAVSFVFSGDIKDALKGYECAESPGPPDVTHNFSVPWDTNRAIDTWLSGEPADAITSLRSILNKSSYYDEGDIVFGFMVLRSQPRRAFGCWLKVIGGKDSDGPPPYNLPSLAAAQLLLHYKPLFRKANNAKCL